MAESAETRNFRDGSVDFKSLLWLAGALATTLGSAALFDNWLDNRINDRVRDYAHEYINPRLNRLEDNQAMQKEFNTKVLQILETQDQSRNRQYGEIIKRTDEQSEILKKMRDSMLVGR